MEIRELKPEEAYDLRSRVLRPGRPLKTVQYPRDQESKHLGVVEGGRVVAIVSAHPEDSPLFSAAGGWRIRGMATDQEFQGRGVGSLLLRGLLAWGREKGVPFFWCNAREKAFAFYERHGFTFESELFEIEDIGPHKVMRVIL
jgi:GNAT superfamily N-acetyltransferase